MSARIAYDSRVDYVIFNAPRILIVQPTARPSAKR